MDTNELTTLLQSCAITKNYFLGVYSCDQIPPKEHYGFYIYNVENSRQRGSHWNLVVNLTEERQHFDSLGRMPPKYIRRPVIYNTQRVQGILATTCGQHVIYTAFLRCGGISYKDILDKYYFNNNSEANDALVTTFMRDHFNYASQITDMNFIISKMRCLLPVAR